MKLKTLHKIFGNTTVGETQGIVIRHKAGVRFFTGKESETDPANQDNYPLFFLQPVTVESDVKEGQWINDWGLSIVLLDILPQDRDAERVNELLDKLLRILQDIIMEFRINYTNGTEVTFDNVTEKLDWDINGTIRIEPVVDKGNSNLTGYTASLILQEQINPSDVVCSLEEIFD